MANDLKSTLRKLIPQLTDGLKGNNVKDLAKKMWSAKHLNYTECDAITNCNDNFTAVTLLVDYIYARGDACIIGFANALRAIQMSALAEKLCPAAASSDCANSRALDLRAGKRIVNERESGAVVPADNVHSQVLLPIHKAENGAETSAEDLKSRLRRLIPVLTEALKGNNVRDLAKKMWSANHLNVTECDTITNCADNFTAVTKLLDFTYARGDECIIGLASALRDIQMSPLAEKLCPAAASSERITKPVIDPRVGAAISIISQRESSAAVVTENVHGTTQLPICQPNNVNVNATNDLKSTLRNLIPELMGALKGNNVKDLAKKMWSASHLNGTEYDSITNCNDNFTAVTLLLDYTYARGDACIIGLASTLRAIQMSNLADKLCPAAAYEQGGQLVTEVITASSSGDQRDHGAVIVSNDNDVPGNLMAVQQWLPTDRKHHGDLLVQSAQHLISLDTRPLYAAVQLRMSMQHTHLEVQVLLHTDIAMLECWQKAWKAKEPNQPIMPLPRLVNVGFSVDQPIVARLASTTDGGATLYHLGFQATKPAQLPGFDELKPSAWLFRLADDQQSNSKKFYYLYLHKASTAFSDEICEKFVIPDYDGMCFLYQLGFTANRLTKRRVKEGALFARPAISGGVHTVKTMRDIIAGAQSVGAIFVPGRGMIGTGFCVGTTDYTYVMTCYHVYNPYEADHAAGNMKISFEDTHTGDARSYVLGHCVAKDEKLDYAILVLQGTNQTLKPISCCSIDFETLVQTEDAADLRLIIVGYCDDIRTVDVALDWHMPEQSDIDLVKDNAANYYMAYYVSFSKSLVDEQIRQMYLEAARLKVSQAVGDYDKMLGVSKDVLFYNVVCHKSGSSGSPVFLFKRDQGIKLVALHERGFPHFYYEEETKSVVQAAIPVEYTIEAGTRLSAIYLDLRNKNVDVCQQIFDNETSAMDETA